MAGKDTPSGHPSLRDFDPYTDQNGDIANGDVEPIHTPRASEVQQIMGSVASGPAETLRLGAGHTGDDATDATAAESAPGVVERLGDATLPGPAEDAIDRATSSLGEDEEGR